ncbi:hypothetical protein AGMMS49574_24960 [Bacteroidia bacterium]|nr:hypothetical protein AGMMS49574_24960 [Bacteroidia bacterium]GHU59243.1 hypothetical protein FACS189411_15850 [Bacteroidia bacterium]
MKNVCYLLIICLFTACSEIRYVGIETYNPSDITYPKSVRKVLVIDNALPQAPDTGYSYLIAGVAQDTCRANADSALFDACRALGNALVDADYFDDVLLFDVGTRQDNAFLADVKLTTEQVQSLCEETGADAVISFDRLLFNMKREVSNTFEGYFNGTIRVDIMGIARSYLPDKNKLPTTVLIADSIFWMESGISIAYLDHILPTPDDALRIAAKYIGMKISSAFVPHWNEETRWYFTSVGSRWKKASAYAGAEKWESASESWQSLYENASGWIEKAKSASNLALYYEMSGDLKKARDLASESYELFLKNKGEENAYTLIQKQYMLTLEKRLQNDRKLNLQIGEE